ncbi:MAG TPA: S9 family peptidase [Ktedonosporobacter sp.]|nr:S9 family peptidase [Ktedonosporobacter sp.]
MEKTRQTGPRQGHSSETQRSASTAARPEATPPRVPATLDAILEMRAPGEIDVTSDGKYVAFVVYELQPGEQKPRARIWVADTAKGKARPVINGKWGAQCPRWSPDGRQLAFITRPESDSTGSSGSRGQEKEKPQLHLMAAHDLLAGESDPGGDGGPGKARLVCKLPNGVSNLSWSPDGSRIAFTSREGDAPKRDPRVLTAARHCRLWTIRPDQSIPEPVTPGGIHVWEYSWSPDSQQMALYYSQGAEDTDWYHSEIGVVAADGGAVRQLTHLQWPARCLAWSPNSQQIAYLAGRWSDPGRGCGDILTISVSSGETRNLTPGITTSPSWCRWLPQGRQLLFCAVKGVTNQVGTVDSNTGAITILEEDFVMQRDQPELATTPDFRFCATLHSHSQQPTDVWFGTIDHKRIEWKRLSRLNPIVEESMALVKTERINYESVDGWRIDGLFTPPLARANADGGQDLTRTKPGDGQPLLSTQEKPPLYVSVHGGPSGTSCDTWNGTNQVFAAAGFAIFQPNMRGSWGHGMAFADAVLGDMGGKDFQDILNGIEYLVKAGKVDGNRVCIGGWSNGGFLSAWAVTQSQRFRAAMVGAGIMDWHNMHAQSNIPDADVLLLAADPLEHPEVYNKCSPMMYARNVKTPTLILHGEDDPAVPVAQAYAFYRALRERKVPVECVIYPREGHGLNERDHLRDAITRQIDWFERYTR